MRLTLQRDDTGSLPMVMMVILVGLTTSAAAMPIVVRQHVATRSFESRNIALNAAQTGLDVMMAKVRAAVDRNGDGALESLPACTLSGNVGVAAAGDVLRYAVTLDYYDDDGTKLTPCPPTSVPATANVTSVGYGKTVSGKTLTRSLNATYVFTTSNTVIPGGQIRIDSSSVGNLCIDGGTAKTPAYKAPVKMQLCNGKASQRFAYTPELYLKFNNSESSTAPYGMCLDAVGGHTAGRAVVFDYCPAPISDRALETPVARFQWSLDTVASMHSTGSGPTIEGQCLTVATPNTPGSAVQLNNCGPADGSRNIWRSSTGVGAGMAGDYTKQLVNYEQFSRCLDVTNNDPNWSYNIAWFCKQSPDTVVDWNQRWDLPPVPKGAAFSAPGNIIATKGSTAYCLRSPLSTASTAYVTMTACSTAAQKSAANVKWTVYHRTGDFDTSYRIMDSGGNCLTPTPLDVPAPDTHPDGTAKVKVADCDASKLQKWNAPPNLEVVTPLINLTEK
jgi:hypothetical protein